MLDELIRSNALDKRWAEELIAGASMLEDLERAAIGTADNRQVADIVLTSGISRGRSAGVSDLRSERGASGCRPFELLAVRG